MENEKDIQVSVEPKKKSLRRDIIEVIGIFVIMLLLFNFVLMSVRVNGPSMVPNYIDGERGIMLRANPFNKVKKQDIVVIDGENAYGEGEGLVVKRVFAMSGDSFEIKNNKIYVNDKEVDDKHRNPNTQMDDYPRIVLEDDYIFILGDNRNISYDSRIVGPVSIHDVKAVHGIMYWPLNKIGIMK